MSSSIPSAMLADVADVNPPAANSLCDADEVSFIPMSAVDARSVTAVDSQTRRYSDVSKGYTPFIDGDVLVAKITPCFENGKIAQVRLRHRFGFGSTEFHVIRPHPAEVDARYLVHYLRQERIRREGESRMIGTAGQRRVPEHFLTALSIPLPSLRVQRRIANILDKASALRSQRRAALTQLNTLAQSIFQDSFGANSTFATQTLDSVCEQITDGTHYTPTYSEAGVIFLSSRNVTSGYIDWDDIKYIPEQLHLELQRRVAPRVDDILLAKNGTTGVAALVDRDCIFDIYVSLALLRPSDRILPIFLREAINSPLCVRQFDASLKGIGVPNLHLKEIRQTRIPVPPIEIQREFVARVQAIEKHRIVQRTSLNTLDVLFASLQHRAFRGEL